MLRKVSADYLTNVFGITALNGETLSDDMVKEYSDGEKLQLEDNDNELVVEYNKLCVKLKQVYKRMGETFGDRFTPYNSGYFYRKKKY